MKVSLTDKLLRCLNCKVPYIQREDGVFRAIKAKQIRKLRYLYKNNKPEFKFQVKNIDRYLLKPYRFDKKVSARERLMELWANKPKEVVKGKDGSDSVEEVRKRMLEWRRKTA